MIPGWGRSPGEGIGYLLQYSWVSLVAQLERICLQCGKPGFDSWDLPHREDPLQKGKATHSSILAWRIPGRGIPWGCLSLAYQLGVKLQYKKYTNLPGGYSCLQSICIICLFKHVKLQQGEVILLKIS